MSNKKEVFVTYSWDNDEHQKKVMAFVKFLRANGYCADMDMSLSQEVTSINFNEMIHKGINEYEKIVIVLSEGYKEKAEKFNGGVSKEYRIIMDEISAHPNKYILTSFDGFTYDRLNNILPLWFRGRYVINLIKDEKNNFNELFSKLQDKKIFDFGDVATKKIQIETQEIIPFSLNDKQQKNDIQADIRDKSRDSDISESDIEVFSDSTSFFNYRISKAFPGVRGIEWINDAKEAIDRLEILLKEPLTKESLTDPIWFFRGSSCSDIEIFKRISDNKCIIGYDECLINRIAAYRSRSYKRSFVYVELHPEIPVGVYEENKESIKFSVENFGYANEEYAIYNGHPITRQEFDDGAAIIDGKVVQFDEVAEIRIRYLTKYNFVICAKFNPINSDKGDDLSEMYLNYMLEDIYKFNEFVDQVEKLPIVREPYK